MRLVCLDALLAPPFEEALLDRVTERTENRRLGAMDGQRERCENLHYHLNQGVLQPPLSQYL